MKLKGRNLKFNMTGEDVALLHKELKKIHIYFDPQEREKKLFGKSTRRAVSRFQKEHGLPKTGQVDEETATAINRAIISWEWHVAISKASKENTLGTLLATFPDFAEFERRKLHQMRLRNAALAAGTEGEEVERLHENLKEFGYSISPEETLKRRFGETTEAAVMEIQEKCGLEPTGEVDEPTAKAFKTLLEKDGAVDGNARSDYGVVSGETPPETERRAVSGGDYRTKGTVSRRVIPGGKPNRLVRGRVVSHELSVLAGLSVVALDKNISREVRLGEGMSGERGAYEINYEWTSLQKEKPDVQVQVLGEDGEILAVSAVRYNAGPIESGLDVLIPADKLHLPAEYPRLIGELGAHLDSQNDSDLKHRLTALKEDDQQQDITYLANKTGWDPRMVAMTSLASRFAERSGIEPEFYYALFRAGVPANDAVLNQMAPDTVRQVWERSVAQQILPAELKEKIPERLEQFKVLRANLLLEEPPQIGVSSFRDLIENVLDDSVKQKRFAQLYYENKDDLGGFWSQARREFGAKATERLQLDGKLGFLTVNNAALIRKLHDRNGDLHSPLDLVRQGLYSREAWEELLVDNIPIPPEIPGKMPADKKANYAASMASQLRLSYPTAVVAKMVRADGYNSDSRLKKAVAGFLDEHQGNFELGVHPIEHYLLKNDITLEEAALAELKKLQRVYQISPSDEVMGKLLEHKIESARDVVRYDEQTFIESFKNHLGGEATARLTYAKAHQVHHAVLNIATSYLLEKKSALPVYAIDNLPALKRREETGVLAYPTLEEVFGELDYCTCEHCRSWLSPAAYLVDLLQFLDNPAAEKNNPLDVLVGRPLDILGRRPDIQHIQLTCENTNTVLPYIDLVNEILEHYVVNGSLESLTGYNIEEGVTTEELLANPQFVSDNAYEIINGRSVQQAEPPPLLPPTPPLPFHRLLELLRRYFENFDLPLYKAMEWLRPNDKLERAGGPDDPSYGWRDILMERLQLSREEYEILTDSGKPLETLYGEPESVSDEGFIEFIERLSNAKNFARRLNLSYEELIEIIRTRFINSHSHLIPKLERLGVNFAVIQDFLEGTLSEESFEDLLPEELDETLYGGDVKEWLRVNETRIMGLIVLSAPADAETICSFDTVELRYSRPDFGSNQLRGFEFLKLLRFIRLWRKLAWSIEMTDKTITALYPADQLPNPDDDDETAKTKLDIGFQSFLMRLAHLQSAMKQLQLEPKRDLAVLLACWSPIDTHGYHSLYRQMFLNPTIFSPNSIFQEDGNGHYLADDTKKVVHHEETLRAAFNLTNEEWNLILEALGFDDETVLNLANISAIFRHGYLARKLRLSIREFLELKAMLVPPKEGEETDPDSIPPPDPFLPLDLAQPPDSAQTNLPFGAVRPTAIRFIEVVQQIADSPLNVSRLLYLLRHIDLGGKASPSREDELSFVRTLRNDLLRIDQELAVQVDPSGEIAKDKMAMVYGGEAADVFFGLLTGTSLFSVSYNHERPTLESEILEVTNRIAYDASREQLSFKGAMTVVEKEGLLNSVSGENNEFQSAVQALFDDGQKFFDRYPELRPLHDAFVFFVHMRTFESYEQEQETLAEGVIQTSGGRLSYDHTSKKLLFVGVMEEEVAEKLKEVADASDDFKEAVDNLLRKNQAAIDDFFEKYPELQVKKGNREAYLKADVSEERQRSLFLSSFLPTLRQQLKKQQVRQMASALVGGDLELVTVLLYKKSILHAADTTEEPAITDFLALEARGFSFDIANDVAGDADQTGTVDNINYQEGAASLPVDSSAEDAVVSGVWSGFIEAPDNGLYIFYVEADSGAEISLTLNGEEMVNKINNTWQSQEVELEPGRLYELTLTAKRVKNLLVMQWERKGMGRVTVPAAQLYPAASKERFSTIYLRLLKAIAIADALGLTGTELEHFATLEDYLIDGKSWLNALPSSAPGDEHTTENTRKLLENVIALIQYRKLKEDFKIQDEGLLALLQDPEASGDDGVPLWSRITGWQAADRDAFLNHFGLAIGDLTDLQQFIRFQKAFATVKKLGIGASALVANTSNEPTPNMLRAIQAALRTRYDRNGWLQVIQPINNTLRSVQRDALVAFVLHRLGQRKETEHIDTPDKLFEYFLIDVQMDHCMKTSRIKQAISSVQLFVQRCLLNLEPEVASSSINSRQWEWMKRYRVWEANRKVFLWPENWLEPELRDDKSSFFKDLESELLQSDITEEAAATALVHYLEKLDEVAKLEICGMYYEENENGNVVHVIARTAGARHTYYYRRQENGISWMPWEKIDLNIEANPVLPVVWKGRLFLFWLSVLQGTAEPNPAPESTSADTLDAILSHLETAAEEKAYTRVSVILYWSEYYHGKWQSVRTSDEKRPIELGFFEPMGNFSFDRDEIILESFEGNSGELLFIGLQYPLQGHKKWYFKLYNTHSLPVRNEDDVENGWDYLPTETRRRILNEKDAPFIIQYDDPVVQDYFRRPILHNVALYETVQPQHPALNIFEAPFFFQDPQHVFYVTSEKIKESVARYLDIGIRLPRQMVIIEPPKLVHSDSNGLSKGVLIAPDVLKPGLVDSSAMESFVRGGSNIRQVMLTAGNIAFGKSLIGPNGSMPFEKKLR